VGSVKIGYFRPISCYSSETVKIEISYCGRLINAEKCKNDP